MYFGGPSGTPVLTSSGRVGGDEVVLIDAGSDKDAGKKALRVIERNGWTLKAVFVTHSHADHIGGCRILQERTDCKIYAKGLECSFTRDPILEPSCFYGGLPFADLKHKFLLAQESDCLALSEDVLPDGMKILPLPGHCFDMVGFLTKDGTAYIGDSVSSEVTIEKYGIGYLWDPCLTLETLEYLKNFSAARYVPSHSPVTEDIAPLADINIRSIGCVMEKIAAFCEDGVTFEVLLKKVFDAYGLVLNPVQYVLIGSTLRSYLSALYTRGSVRAAMPSMVFPSAIPTARSFAATAFRDLTKRMSRCCIPRT